MKPGKYLLSFHIFSLIFLNSFLTITKLRLNRFCAQTPKCKTLLKSIQVVGRYRGHSHSRTNVIFFVIPQVGLGVQYNVSLTHLHSLIFFIYLSLGM